MPQIYEFTFAFCFLYDSKHMVIFKETFDTWKKLKKTFYLNSKDIYDFSFSDCYTHQELSSIKADIYF